MKNIEQVNSIHKESPVLTVSKQIMFKNLQVLRNTIFNIICVFFMYLSFEYDLFKKEILIGVSIIFIARILHFLSNK